MLISGLERGCIRKILQGTPPEIKFRNFWCYQLEPEVELEKSSLPEMKNESDTFLGQIEGLMIRGIT